MVRARVLKSVVAVVVGVAACGGAARQQGKSSGAEPPALGEVAAGHHGAHGGASPPSWKLADLPKGAVAIADLGTHARKVTTSSPEAQAFFDQGLRLTYGFNHDEAARSFAKAAELDPTCAMCSWGVALTLGPNYNIPMLPDRSQAAWDALGRAMATAKNASPVEQALIGALARRYKGPEWLDPPAMQPFQEAYASAMRDVAAKFPDDLDVQTLFAEALMNVNPWKLWTPDGKPVGATPEIVATLERVLARAPDHPGANHYYIHAIEASRDPGKGVPSADRLPKLMPAAGHTVHMPAHIYQRVGRYADASRANRNAVEVDRAYLAKITPLGYYPAYVAHNTGFLAYSASMEGKAAESLAAARESAQTMPKDLVCGMPGMDFFLGEPLLVMVRFGRWQELLVEPKPDAKYALLSALWHHAHGMALAATGKPDGARADLAAIRAIGKAMPKDLLAGLNAGTGIAEVAAKALEARIAESERKPEAIALWEQAVVLEDALAYSEPADWFYPLRHSLGAVLLDAGRVKDAEAVYRADLERNPKNGWALFGLWKALEGQQRGKEAKLAEAQFRRAWPDADVAITRTAF